MYSTRTRHQRRRSGCNANANTTMKFRLHPSNAPEWSYVDQGDILYDTEIEQTRTDEEYVTENEEEQEVKRGAIIGGRRSKRLGRSRDERFVG